jgi:DNA-directed RNA polymerase subunit beta'
VLPPRFRPITDTGSMQMIADMNYLYKELFSMNKNLKELGQELGADSTGKEKLALYKMIKATVGLADPGSAKLKQKNVNGLIRHILGSNPKYSMFQRKVLSSTVEGVGNAVIAPDPSMDMDHVGIPEDMAYTVFRPYVIRALTASGANPLEALKQVENRTESAKRALLHEMEKRPVIITRAPVLHKYNFMAAKPVLTAGSTMRMSPSVVVGFNADFDGDQMRLHVPSSVGAVREAYERMLPSRNLLSAATFQAHPFIKNEFLYGLFLASKDRADKKNIKTFRTKDDVIKAFNRGEVNASDTVKIIGGA